MPPDPWTYAIPQTTQHITFSNYNHPLAQRDVNAVFLQTANAIIAALSTNGDGPIGAGELKLQAGRVRLILYPCPSMTWVMLGATLEGLTNFVNFFEFVGFDFVIHETDAWLEVGCGLLAFIGINP